MAGSQEQVAVPTGTVALLLGDIEGSTALWEAQATTMATATTAMDAAIGAAVARYRGARPVEQGEGDSFVAAFARVTDAIACALDLQQATAAGFLRIRMGIHVGEVQLRDEGNYFGPTINRAARVRDAGHGGQVLLSGIAADLAVDGLPPGVGLDDLGEHRLKDLPRPERLWQLTHPDLAVEFPPLRVADALRTNVLPQLTTFIGRDGELVTLHELVDANPCVTITGAGGCGKTRLALELASGRAHAHPAGIWFVDLAAVDTGAAVAPAVAEAMHLELLDARPVERRIAAAVGTGVVLLVLDNCEHLIGACTALTVELLQRCPSLHVLATSREPLGVAGEVTYRLPSLGAVPARELFVERARRAVPGFEPHGADEEAVEAICARLDGIPLAIELAAARLRVFTVAQVLDGLHDRFRLLTGGARTAMPRQQTLQASVEWSFALLLEPERVVLRRLAVFADGFTLAAAAAVCSAPPIEPHHVVDVVGQLVDKSLVVADEATAGRYRLLETLRQFALSKLLEAGEAGEARRRHYDHVLAEFQALRGSRDWTDADRRRVHDEEANTRRALQWASEQEDPRLLHELCSNLFGYWVTSRARDGVAWTGEVRVEDPRISARERADSLSRHALLLGNTGAWAVAADVGERALRAARDAGHEPAIARAGIVLVYATGNMGQSDFALLDEAIDLARRHDEPATLAQGLFARGWLLARRGRPRDPGPVLEEAEALAVSLGLTFVARMSRASLAQLRYFRGEARVALPALDASVEELEGAEHHFFLANTLALRAAVRAEVGDDPGADADLGRLVELLDLLRDDQTTLMLGLGTLAVMIARGQFEEAAAAMAVNPLEARPAGDDFAVLLFAIRALCRAGAGQADEALEDCERVPPDSIVNRADLLAAFSRVLVARLQGDLGLAWDLGRDVLAARPSDEGHPVLDHALRVLADVAARTGRAEDAARLLGAAAARTELVGSRTDVPTIGLMAGDAEGRARAELGDERFDELFEQGLGLDWDAVAAYIQRGRGARSRPSTGWGSLTPTEAGVVDLVLDGLANKEIAARLLMSVATVKSHLTHVYAKLGIGSRSQLAAAARRRTPTPS